MANTEIHRVINHRMTNNTIYTIGYGQRSIGEFIDLLRRYRIQRLIDVRSAPYSKYQPDYCKAALEQTILQNGFDYLFMGNELGGRPADPQSLTNGVVDYDKRRIQPLFLNAVETLITMARRNESIALMCCEERPEHCHRNRLLGVSLHTKGMHIQHIDSDGACIDHEQAMHRLTQGQLDLFQ